MFGKKKNNDKNDKLDFETKNHQMKGSYNSSELVVANLEYVSNDGVPMVNTTNQKYLFEIINDNGKTRYREIFTGFIADIEEKCYFNLPYIVNLVELKEIMPRISDSIPKYALLILLNEVNKEEIKDNKKCK